MINILELMHFKPYILFEEGLCSLYILPFCALLRFIPDFLCIWFYKWTEMQNRSDTSEAQHLSVIHEEKTTKKSTQTYKEQEAEQNKHI